MDKKAIREQILKKRNRLTKEQIMYGGKIALKELMKEDAWEKSEVVYLYSSFGSEVSTNELLTTCFQKRKKVALPKVISKGLMEFYEVTHRTDLIYGFQGILEPNAKCKPIKEPGLMIIPGVAFDKENHRIGYGGGYYDRYLSKHKNVAYKKIGLSYSFQILPYIQTESFDQRVDKVITIFLPS